MRDHKKLKAFELADRLTLLTYECTRQFPKEELFGLTSQMRRAAVSAPSNIVEGAARQSEQEFVRFLEIAYGSLRELEYQISLASRLGFLDGEASTKLQELSTESTKVLNGLIRSFKT